MTIVTGVLDTADRGHILGALAAFANRAPGQWCPAGHPASDGQLPNWRAMASLPPARAIEAVAAAGPNHCIDGWSYASRALSAVLSGDAHAARHLAYYAQLRAGLSILSNLGVGIFNRTNFVITAAGTITRLDTSPPRKPNGPGMGTHDVVWEALKEFALGARTSRIFLELVKIRRTSLKECLDAIWPGIPATAAATNLIEAWGVDLRRGKEEHKNRNISSYSPQAMNPLGPLAPDGLRFVEGFWTLFEPTSGSSFDNLDRFLLRSLLLKQHRTVANNKDYSTGAIALRYHELPASIRGLASVEFLTNTQQPRNPDLLQRANARTQPAQATEMLARAFLLLRTATAFTHNSLVEAGVNCAGGDLRAWIDPWAEARGFWSPADPLIDPIDLWADVALAMIDFVDSLSPEPTCMNDWMARSAKGLPTLYEAERVGVWSLCA
jgi:hypothetical protein